MTALRFLLPDGTTRRVEGRDNTSMMQAARAAKIPGIAGECEGAMACATCHVYIPENWAARVAAQDSEKTPEEQDILELSPALRPQSRLSCQLLITPALEGLVVGLPGCDPDLLARLSRGER